LFATVVDRLAKSGCINDARVVVEKPFGRDLASAQELNRTLHAHFSEQAIFRFDHYLGGGFIGIAAALTMNGKSVVMAPGVRIDWKLDDCHGEQHV
jgi:glucose-6-phosphate 1-dehydrogenase